MWEGGFMVLGDTSQRPLVGVMEIGVATIIHALDTHNIAMGLGLCSYILFMSI